MKGQFLKTTLPLLIVFIAMSSAIAQPDLQEQYDEFYNKSSTWEDYKVIKLYRLDNFWSIVSDSLRVKKEQLNSAKNEIRSLNEQVTDLNNQLSETQSELEASQRLNDSISFLGAQISKIGYNILVWLIILGLCAGCGALYLIFRRSNYVTRQTRKAYSELETEHQRLRDRANETKIKLKRELQTALNELHEHRVSD